jgi:chemotaxis signal transduction protein
VLGSPPAVVGMALLGGQVVTVVDPAHLISV